LETGLYYNRFRYYSPSEGCYTQPDPIGLAGNNPTLYLYVRNTNRDLDIFGLAPWDFNVWFNSATPEEVRQNITAVKRQLRNDGGMHELFPVSLAPKARELGTNLLNSNKKSHNIF